MFAVILFLNIDCSDTFPYPGHKLKENKYFHYLQQIKMNAMISLMMQAKDPVTGGENHL